MRKLVLVAVTLPLLCTALAAADVSGEWTLNLDPDFGGNPDTVNCTFKQNSTNLTIRCGAGATGDGEVNGLKVTFRIPTGQRNELTATFVADVASGGTTMKGTWRLVDHDNKESNGKFDGKKN